MKTLLAKIVKYRAYIAVATVSFLIGAWLEFLLIQGWYGFWAAVERFQILLVGILAISGGFSTLYAGWRRRKHELELADKLVRYERKAIAAVFIGEVDENFRSFQNWAKLVNGHHEGKIVAGHRPTGEYEPPPSLSWEQYKENRNSIGRLGPNGAHLFHMTIASCRNHESRFKGRPKRELFSPDMPNPILNQIKVLADALRECAKTGNAIEVSWCSEPVSEELES